jgi:uncharacterized protein DUF4160
MFFNEEIHAGRPHFHAEYGGVMASYDIASLDRLAGELRVNVERLVKKWASTRQNELMGNWDRARDHHPIRPVDPLK